MTNPQTAAPGVAVEQELQQEFENRVRFNPLNPKNCLDKNADGEYISPFIYACWMEFIAGSKWNASRTALLAGAAGGQEPVAWVVWWGIGDMQKNSVHFERKTAEEVAKAIKSVTEIRPLFAHPPVPVRAPQELDGEALRKLWIESGEPGNFTGDFIPLVRRIERAAGRQGTGALPAKRGFSDQEIWDWAKRHDLRISSLSDLRCIADDAASMANLAATQPSAAAEPKSLWANLRSIKAALTGELGKQTIPYLYAEKVAIDDIEFLFRAPPGEVQVDAAQVPRHLDLSAGPLFRCTSCGRQSWASADVGHLCGMPQPNKENCAGTMVASHQAGVSGGA